MPGKKILIMGDGGQRFRTISWALVSEGYYVRLARRPEDALALMIDKDFDLIIARLRMEDWQSLDVFNRGKKLNPEVKFILIGSDGDVAFPLTAFHIDIDDYLSLAASPDEVVRRTGQCLKKAAAVRSAKGADAPQGALINEKTSNRILNLRP